jgi:hypothetical protein
MVAVVIIRQYHQVTLPVATNEQKTIYATRVCVYTEHTLQVVATV